MLTVIANLKGGVGKSTLTFNLAIWLLETGHRTVIFDLDPQKTLSDAINVRDEEGYTPRLVAYDSLIDFDRAAQEKPQQYILVDSSGSNMEATLHAIAAADRVVIPVLPSQADIWSTQRFVRQLQSHFNHKLPEIFTFINRGDTHPGVCESDETEYALKQLPGTHHINNRLYQRTAYRRSFSEGLAVFEMSPLSKAGQEFLHLANTLFP